MLGIGAQSAAQPADQNLGPDLGIDEKSNYTVDDYEQRSISHFFL